MFNVMLEMMGFVECCKRNLNSDYHKAFERKVMGRNGTVYFREVSQDVIDSYIEEGLVVMVDTDDHGSIPQATSKPWLRLVNGEWF